MTLPLTLGLLAAFLAFAVFCGWRGALPPTFKNGPRMIPWRPLMVIGALGVMVMLAHLSTLLKGVPE
ncbi:MAG: hypothetical protein JWP35_3339 [Caulobacter sp.]|nr:hypothetical protein [Caulobacter sp.]